MESKTTCLRLALPTPLRRCFDYLPPQGIDIKRLKPGVRVKVPFQSRQLVGILIEIVNESTVPYEKLKAAMEVLDDSPLITDEVFKLCQFAADYYHYSLGEVLAGALPTILRKRKVEFSKYKLSFTATVTEENLHLNAAQALAVRQIAAAKKTFQVFLLDGVTGSGKTEVYLQTIAQILALGQQVLVLVPEISLTPQTIDRFRKRFSVNIVALHSELTDKERLSAWLAARAGEAKIVIGTRSAIFTPFADLGLLIVDEEHDSSFKQQDRFRYHARDLAIMRARYNSVPIVLGSATPSLESLLNVARERYTHLSLPIRAGKASFPSYSLIDLRLYPQEEGLSTPLLNAVETHLKQGNQVMLFLNRRGFAPVLFCTHCNWIAECHRCDARLVYHAKRAMLKCHHCDGRVSVPKKCKQCGEQALIPLGVGTQRLEETLQKHFPDVPIIRFDRDSTQKKGSMTSLLTQIHKEERAILLGTQMLAKGHHFPHVTLVGIVDADSGFFSADFRAVEQMGQLLLQVSGRAGRGEKPGTVIIQTHHPEDALLQKLINEGYAMFAKELLQQRKEAGLPPFSYFCMIRAEGYHQEKCNNFLLDVKESNQEKVLVLGPAAALMAKRKGLYCQQLLVKSISRPALQDWLKRLLKNLIDHPQSSAIKWTIDVDPVEV